MRASTVGPSNVLSRPRTDPSDDGSIATADSENLEELPVVGTRLLSGYNRFFSDPEAIDATGTLSLRRRRGYGAESALMEPERRDAAPLTSPHRAINLDECPELDNKQFVPTSLCRLHDQLKKIPGLSFAQIRTEAVRVDQNVVNLLASSNTLGKVKVNALNKEYFDLEVECLDFALKAAFYYGGAILNFVKPYNGNDNGEAELFTEAENNYIYETALNYTSSHNRAQDILNAVLRYYLSVQMQNLSPTEIVDYLAPVKKLNCITDDNAKEELEKAFILFSAQKMNHATWPVDDEYCSCKQAVESILRWYEALDNELWAIMVQVKNALPEPDETDSDHEPHTPTAIGDSEESTAVGHHES